MIRSLAIPTIWGIATAVTGREEIVSQPLNVWSICLHLGSLGVKCRQIDHTLSVWMCLGMMPYMDTTIWYIKPRVSQPNFTSCCCGEIAAGFAMRNLYSSRRFFWICCGYNSSVPKPLLICPVTTKSTGFYMLLFGYICLFPEIISTEWATNSCLIFLNWVYGCFWTNDSF